MGQDWAHFQQDRPRRLFIILNPYGGKRCELKLFQNEVKSLLEASDVLYTLQETSYQLHAQELYVSAVMVFLCRSQAFFRCYQCAAKRDKVF
ncbi:putative sphingosine kinase [Dioscorea sansibarensis]